ncbi:SDR family NAD(P)-dependent oxidoreductase [Nocardioides immobilis]|uniref:SDR family NAD(P)-dependent oxidoreductase n=1 Tax=Nocardioides immobilis TaxID=2049295 RepID=A0A417Y1F0_9ACTN|nr:SDR family NAD(P)-dependent oxidoreductase [Nocardioides immobilis]RHW26425.1 SDR family NAD(P)-dependent oxidoreductase [Nocardioides immobilis]
MKVALVTGASRGIGQATARRLARDCGHVIVAARDVSTAEETADRLRREGLSASALQLDVTDDTSVRAAAEEVAASYGHLDVLVNNAGVLPEATHPEPAEAVDLAMFRRTFDTNLFGAVAVLEAFLPLLRKSESGRIVNVSSTMGSLADQTNHDSPYYELAVPAYQSSKAALNNVTIALAKALADTPIKVTSVCPGWVQTDLAPGNREQAPLTSDQAADVVHRAATLPDDAVSGTFVDAAGTVPW